MSEVVEATDATETEVTGFIAPLTVLAPVIDKETGEAIEAKFSVAPDGYRKYMKSEGIPEEMQKKFLEAEQKLMVEAFKFAGENAAENAIATTVNIRRTIGNSVDYGVAGYRKVRKPLSPAVRAEMVARGEDPSTAPVEYVESYGRMSVQEHRTIPAAVRTMQEKIQSDVAAGFAKLRK
jgi:hypothetical protein